jgi:hypothetical protein
MKGIVFSEFIEMVEEQFSPELADKIIVDADLASGGAYTAVGTYDHDEMLKLVDRLSRETGIEPDELVKAFGRYLFGRFQSLYPGFFQGVSGTFGFLSTIDNHVHVEVRKLYPDAELPKFECEEVDADTVIMTYRSKRPFGNLAAGLMEGCISHFEENIAIEREDLSGGENRHVRFTLRRS